MDRLEVLEVLGEPTIRFDGPSSFSVKGNATTQTTRQRLATQPTTPQLDDATQLAMTGLFLSAFADNGFKWCYGPGGLFGALDNLLGPSPKAYVVEFDNARHLKSWRKPLATGDDKGRPHTSDQQIQWAIANLLACEDLSAKVDPPEASDFETPTELPQPDHLSIDAEYRDLRLKWSVDASTPVGTKFRAVVETFPTAAHPAATQPTTLETILTGSGIPDVWQRRMRFSYVTEQRFIDLNLRCAAFKWRVCALNGQIQGKWSAWQVVPQPMNLETSLGAK